jgi:cytochrome P450
MLSRVTIPDLSDPSTFADGVPHDVFDELRRMDGLYWQPTRYATQNGGFWAVTRFADIVEIERHPELFTSTRGAAFPGTNLPADNRGADGLMQMDPPRHSGVRRAAAKSFGGRVIGNFEPWVREIVDETLDQVETLGEFDYVTEVAAVVPSLVIARVMGVRREDRGLIVDWTTRSFAAQQIQDGSRDREEAAIQGDIFRYIGGVLVSDKRSNPADDMTSVLLRGVDRDALSVNESLHFLFLLIAAGFETTHTLIGQSMRMMLEDPQVLDRTNRAMESLGPDKVAEEFLRLVTPAMNMARTATRDVELGDQQVREGDLMQMYFTAANRDPAVFDDPHIFDPWRAEPDSLAFGSGAHRCMGSALAKLELRVLMEQMTSRQLKLRLNGPPCRGWSVFINQLTSLPVARSPEH